VFDLPFSSVTVRNEHLGGRFGAGLAMNRELVTALLSRKVRKPVKLVYSRQDEFLDRPTRSCFGPYEVKIGVNDDGHIGPVLRKIVSVAGAYVEAAGLQALVAGASSNPLYRRTSSRIDVEVVYTNEVPCGPMRGFGNPEDCFVREQVIDEAACGIGVDPLDFRLKNIAHIGDPGFFGPDFPIEASAIADCLRIGAERIGWKEKRGARRVDGPRSSGTGISCMSHVSGAWPSHVEHSSSTVKLNEDGTAVLIAWPAPMGTNCTTSLAQVAAETLGIRTQDVKVVWGNTDFNSFEVGSHASRSMYVVGRAVQLAAQEARDKLLTRAASLLEHPAESLEISDGYIHPSDGSGKSVSVGEVIRGALYATVNVGDVMGNASYSPSVAPPSYQAVFADIDVDRETGEIEVNKMVLVNDSGRSINPMTVEGQLEGGTAQGLGYALWEDPSLDPQSGRVRADDFDTYKIASALDMPELDVVLLESPEPSGPFGAKGAGEPGCVNQAAAIANALYDALGVRVWRLPITPEKVLAAIAASEQRFSA
jgi:xanthine dehydrogenase molybdenum-binding subunit